MADKPTSAVGRQDGGYEVPILTEPHGGPVPTYRPADAGRARNELKDYWLHGEGAGRWTRWTDLYRHLKKHMPDEMAKRVAAEWFHERYGYWPGHQKGSNPTGPG